MKIYYVNHCGEEIDLMKWPYKIAESDLFDYNWNYETKNEQNPRITSFKRGMSEKTVKIAVSAGSQEQYHRALERMLSVMEKDVLRISPGKLYVNQEYLPCYFFKSQKTEWVPGIPFLNNTFSLVAENSAWIKETRTNFYASGSQLPEEAESGKNLDYNFDYPFDYSNGMKNQILKNDSFSDTEFEITIYGPCVNPVIYIGGHAYGVETILDRGEYMKINSKTRKIYKIKLNGEVVNQFHLRDRESYIFEKILPGNNAISWNGLFGFEVRLLEERSEPRWI